MTALHEHKLREEERRARLASAEKAGEYFAGWLEAVRLKEESAEYIDGASKQLADAAYRFFKVFRLRRKPHRGPFRPKTRGDAHGFFTQRRIERFLNATPLEFRVDVDSQGPPIKLVPQAPGLGGAAFGDFQDAFMALLKLSDEGILDRLRKCESHQCKHWFYALRSDGRFHEPACRIAYDKENWQRQEKRAKFMQKLRASGEDIDRDVRRDTRAIFLKKQAENKPLVKHAHEVTKRLKDAVAARNDLY